MKCGWIRLTALVLALFSQFSAAPCFGAETLQELKARYRRIHAELKASRDKALESLPVVDMDTPEAVKSKIFQMRDEINRGYDDLVAIYVRMYKTEAASLADAAPWSKPGRTSPSKSIDNPSNPVADTSSVERARLDGMSATRTTVKSMLPFNAMRITRVIDMPKGFSNQYWGHACALSFDGNVVVNVAGRKGEGKAYDIRRNVVACFWRNPGKGWKVASTPWVRTSFDGSIVAFSLTDANGFRSAVVVKDVWKSTPPRIYDMTAFLRRRFPDIASTRGITGGDMSGDGGIVYAVVSYALRKDGDYARSYPNRRAIVKIKTRGAFENGSSIILHSLASAGDGKCYPFQALTTNMKGVSFAFLDSWKQPWVFTSEWVRKVGVYDMGLPKIPLGNGPVLMGMGDGPWIFYKSARGAIVAARWKDARVAGSFSYGGEAYRSRRFPKGSCYALPFNVRGSRFVSYDGNHLVYRTRNKLDDYVVWYDMRDRAYALNLPKFKDKWFHSRLLPDSSSVNSYANWMSADASTILLRKKCVRINSDHLTTLMVIEVAKP